jgi:hypothetical protein
VEPADGRPPVHCDGRGFTPKTVVAPGEVRVQQTVVRRPPIPALVIKEMSFFHAGHLNLWMFTENGIERGGARLLGSGDCERELTHGYPSARPIAELI